jgi:16S rRNA (adenine1518-N6/adenine1519-N6)-dimethyltransferase
MSLPLMDIPAILRHYSLRPDKKLGQNFLIDPAALERIVQIAEISPHDCVLEIGPGLGSLTRYLAATARRVVAVELDRKLIPVLNDILVGYPNVTLIQGDILALNPKVILEKGCQIEDRDELADYLVVANIPYYITSALIRHLLEAPVKPARLVLTVQREVAERICASPGDLSLLALSVQVYGVPQVKTHIPAGAFYPAPQVDSAVVRVDLYPEPLIPQDWLGDFFHLAKAGYSQKRKTLRNALSGGLASPAQQVSELLTQAGIDPQQRAETVTLIEWKALTNLYRQRAHPGGISPSV